MRPRTAWDFIKVQKRWERRGSSPCDQHDFDHWYPDLGLPHEGWGCTRCGQYFEDRSSTGDDW